ncbi:MAG: FHA domain-containing protein [Acidobacteriota bacterium]
MTEKTPTSKHSISADWLFRGVLTKLGDTFDRFTGRRWVPSSSLATSELVERLKKLLDSEVKQVSGKGAVVPHDISLKMQWDKFSDDGEKGINALRSELLTAAADHINDSLYYTLAPLTLDVKTDYFTEGVKLSVSFGKFDPEAQGVEVNVTIPSVNLGSFEGSQPETFTSPGEVLLASYAIHDVPVETRLALSPNGRISVGRTGASMLALDDPSVSKMHASILALSDGSLAIADTGSTNGTFINDERIAYGRSVVFSPDDKVKFGSVEIHFDRIPAPVKEPDKDVEIVNLENTVEVGGLEFTNRKLSESAAEPKPIPYLPSSGPLTIACSNADAEAGDPKEERISVGPHDDLKTG